MPSADLEGEFEESQEWTSVEVKNARKYFRCTFFGGLTSAYVYLILVSAFDVFILGSEDIFGDKAFTLLVGYLVGLLLGLPSVIILVDHQKRKYSVRKFVAKSLVELRSWYGNPLIVSVGLAIVVSLIVIFDVWIQNPSEFDLVLMLRGEKRWTLLAVLAFFPAVYFILRFSWQKANKLIEQFS